MNYILQKEAYFQEKPPVNPLAQYLQQNLPEIRPEALEMAVHAFSQKELKKGEQLLRQGDVCQHVYFLVEGMCRSDSIKDGKDITTWFFFQHDFVTSFTNFFPKDLSYESIEMLTVGKGKRPTSGIGVSVQLWKALLPTSHPHGRPGCQRFNGCSFEGEGVRECIAFEGSSRKTE